MRLTLRVIAILSLIVSIVWLIFVRTFDPIIAFLVSLATLIATFVGETKGESETLDQRNRRIMLNHVEEFWVKGILEKSLYGAALLDLDIKEDPDALDYPWTIKRESNQETLPLGKPMLEIFQEIGLGRSLLILGAPGSGKTTMLLELTRQLIKKARQDEIEPIPVVFLLASWAEKQTMGEWLATELNTFYDVPKKEAPGWITNNKILLLLDGLDEVKQESRSKCVNAINIFRKEHGLTSMAVCSRSQEYAELKKRLAFGGAIKIQPLTKKQVNAYFERSGKRLAGIKKVLEKDTPLREMAETPLFLNIMTLAYQDTESAKILIFKDIHEQRKQLFDTYIARMFERHKRSKNEHFKKQDVLHWLAWLAHKMIAHNQVPYLLERMQPNWLSRKKHLLSYLLIVGLIVGLIYGLNFGLIVGLIGGLIVGLIGGLGTGLSEIRTVDALAWSWRKARKGLILGLIVGLIPVFYGGLFSGLIVGLIPIFYGGVFSGLLVGLIPVFYGGLFSGLIVQQIDQTIHPGQRLSFTFRSFFFAWQIFELIFGPIIGLIGVRVFSRLIGLRLFGGLIGGFYGGLFFGLLYGGNAIIQHYSLRLILSTNNILPWKLIPFLDYATDLIFLRRVGGGYIFVHRLLMEHFADMYADNS